MHLGGTERGKKLLKEPVIDFMLVGKSASIFTFYRLAAHAHPSEIGNLLKGAQYKN